MCECVELALANTLILFLFFRLSRSLVDLKLLQSKFCTSYSYSCNMVIYTVRSVYEHTSYTPDTVYQVIFVW